jgi:hypothetical protein
MDDMGLYSQGPRGHNRLSLRVNLLSLRTDLLTVDLFPCPPHYPHDCDQQFYGPQYNGPNELSGVLYALCVPPYSYILDLLRPQGLGHLQFREYTILSSRELQSHDGTI